MLADMDIDKSKLVVLAVPVVAVAAVVIAVSTGHIEIYEELPLGSSETPDIEVSYSDDRNLLQLKVVNGSFTAHSGYVTFDHNETGNLTIIGYGKREKTDYWAKNTLLPNNEGITDFPITAGENISIRLENTKTLAIYTSDHGKAVNSHVIINASCNPKIHEGFYSWENESQQEKYRTTECR